MVREDFLALSGYMYNIHWQEQHQSPTDWSLIVWMWMMSYSVPTTIIGRHNSSRRYTGTRVGLYATEGRCTTTSWIGWRGRTSMCRPFSDIN